MTVEEMEVVSAGECARRGMTLCNCKIEEMLLVVQLFLSGAKVW